MAEQLRVFISHSHQDNAFCHAIVAALRDAGADVWYDEHDLGAGRLQEEILRELDTRKIFAVIHSKHAIASKWVKREMDWAEELKERDPTRVILPVTAGQIERDDFNARNGWLAYYSYKRIEAPGYKPYPVAEAARRLLHTLSLTPHGVAIDAFPPFPSKPVATRSNLPSSGKSVVSRKVIAWVAPLFATQLAPKAAIVLCDKGIALADANRLEEALAAFDQALAIAPNDAAIWRNRSIVLDRLDRTTEAEATEKRAEELGWGSNIEWG